MQRGIEHSAFYLYMASQDQKLFWTVVTHDPENCTEYTEMTTKRLTHTSFRFK